jgi:hypothetical protein
VTIDRHLDEDGEVDRLERDDSREDEHDLVETETEKLQLVIFPSTHLLNLRIWYEAK